MTNSSTARGFPVSGVRTSSGGGDVATGSEASASRSTPGARALPRPGPPATGPGRGPCRAGVVGGHCGSAVADVGTLARHEPGIPLQPRQAGTHVAVSADPAAGSSRARRTPAPAVPASAELQDALLAWAEPRLRGLPWRRTRDPWRVLVAEVMLQQTGVARVLERYEDFCERFPTPAVCAAAPAGAVIEAWRGLGYNRRALHLHAAARRITAAGGRFPDDLDGLLVLPGVGPYTARAVLSLAFERDVGVVDTNVGRLLARLAGRRLRPSEAQATADELVPPGSAWLWNQALFDLGATVCTRRSADCESCPLPAHCAWRGEGPDPADGSAGVSTFQAPFEGSDRQCRGRLVEALRSGPQPASAAARLMGLEDDPPRARRILESLLRDGLVVSHDSMLKLPRS